MSITLDELAVSLGKSRSTIKRIVDALKIKGFLTVKVLVRMDGGS